MLCVTASNNILENANCEEDMLCAITAELHDDLQDEDMLCFPDSLIVKKILFFFFFNLYWCPTHTNLIVRDLAPEVFFFFLHLFSIILPCLTLTYLPAQAWYEEAYI